MSIWLRVCSTLSKLDNPNLLWIISPPQSYEDLTRVRCHDFDYSVLTIERRRCGFEWRTPQKELYETAVEQADRETDRQQERERERERERSMHEKERPGREVSNAEIVNFIREEAARGQMEHLGEGHLGVGRPGEEYQEEGHPGAEELQEVGHPSTVLPLVVAHLEAGHLGEGHLDAGEHQEAGHPSMVLPSVVALLEIQTSGRGIQEGVRRAAAVLPADREAGHQGTGVAPVGRADERGSVADWSCALEEPLLVAEALLPEPRVRRQADRKKTSKNRHKAERTNPYIISEHFCRKKKRRRLFWPTWSRRADLQ